MTSDANQDDEFIVVTSKNKPKNILLIPPTRDYAFQTIQTILKKYDAKASFIFGSFVKGSHAPNDIDILVIWPNSLGIPENIYDIYLELQKELKFPIDLINMIHVGKPVAHDRHSITFIRDHIYPDAIQVFNRTSAHKNIIKHCQFYGKCKPKR